MKDSDALAEGLGEKTAAALRAISGAMGAGVVIFGAVVLFVHAGAAAPPQPGDARLINIMTMLAMAWSAGAVFMGEFLWKRQVRAVEDPAHAGAAVQTAFILRLAAREGAALLGLVVCLLAAMKGVLRVYPAYWVNLAPSALFLFFLAARWPSLENLRGQVREV